MARWLTRKKSGKFGWVNDDLKAAGWQPARVVALVRLPFLWGGFFNYFFSLSDVEPAVYLCGNAVGFIPGSLLFSLLGHKAGTLLTVLTDGDADHSEIAIVCVEFTLIVAAIAVLGMRFRALWRDRSAIVTTEDIGGSTGANNPTARVGLECGNAGLTCDSCAAAQAS